jgi:hypothetical protein
MSSKPTTATRVINAWPDRITAGELPASQPPRAQGLERNVVITVWDWAGPKAYLHDEITTDKRNPTVNGSGPLYGAHEESTDLVPILDPVRHTARGMKMPVRDPKMPSSKQNPMAPSPYWGEEAIWDSQTSMHNPMLDEQGRLWFTARVRPPENPAFCKQGSDHPSAKLFPVERSNRHLSMYDPKTGKFTLISKRFPAHHLQFGFDASNTLWTGAGGPAANVVGWLNTKMTVVDLRHKRAVSRRRRQRDVEPGREIPASPRSAREVNGSRKARDGRCPARCDVGRGV